MIYPCNIRTVRAALGAALLALVAACSDAPSGPAMPTSGAHAKEQAVPAPADRAIQEVGLPALQPGERRVRRTVQGPDARTMNIESIIDRDGRVSATLIRSGGRTLRLVNERQGGGIVRQVASVLGADGVMRTLDSRAVSAADLENARVQLRREAEQMTPAQAGRLLRIESEMGVCDAEVKAANIATWQYVAAASAVIIVSASGSPVASLAAWTAYLAAYANYESKQVDLDKCVERAGKKPMDEY